MKREHRSRVLLAGIERLEARLDQLRQRSHLYSWLRLGTAFGGLLLTAGAYSYAPPQITILVLVLVVVLFAIMVAIHRRLDRGIARFEAWCQLQRTQLARMRLAWDAIPPPADLERDHQHPFEADLDLVGERSLYHLLDVTSSVGGSQRLRRWLTTTEPAYAEIKQRQRLVEELRPRTWWRHRLVLATRVADNQRKHWQADGLLAWLQKQQPIGMLRGWFVALTIFALLNLTLGLLNWLGPWPAYYLPGYLLYFMALLAWNNRTRTSFRDAFHLRDGMEQLSEVFTLLEADHYAGVPNLRQLCGPFLEPARRPSDYLRRVNRVLAAAGLRQNPAVWLVIHLIFPMDLLVALRLAAARRQLADRISVWLDVWYEVEALSALANFSYLNPDTTSMPLIQPERELEEDSPQQFGFVFQAANIGHPLLPAEVRVHNSFGLERLGTVVLLTGSNMSGKSTFLRTLGLNLALAYAGGAVMAESLHTVLFRLYTAIHVTDSVNDGISYFYAEVKRLKSLLAALREEHPRPLFFLIDEIFRGTNNRERLIGSQAYVQALSGQHGVGIISTHDLELVQLEENTPQVRNYHFRDDFAQRRMMFDYTLRPGPSPTTNALKIMRLEGLPVAQEEA